ncbi:uncharacterized protein LOC134214598 [Armigeres subalbatus]|uniref:uncharacterized protein LOC134214598 n=1 Tax=Armigeres subalbatus TaxID=124917 RepID=UPI002ED00D87
MTLMISREHVVIAEVRKCITNNRVNSGDTDYDQQEQRNFNQTIRTMIRTLLVFSFAISVLFTMPNPVIRKSIGLPPQLLPKRPIVSSILNSVVMYWAALIIQHRHATTLTCIGTLLLGMRSKLRLLVHRYNRILAQPVINEQEFFSNIGPEIRETLKNHVEYWRFLSHLKNLVGMSFALVHCCSILNTGIVLFVGKVNGIDFFSVALVFSASFFMIEYLLLCRLVEGLQDEANKICYIIYELCSKIPYSKEHHSTYVQLRSTLMIAWVNTSNGIEMNCYGVLSISSITFVKLVNVTYSVLTFLVGFD